MTTDSNRSVLSAIKIEPVDSHEYNKKLVEELIPYHKQKFLQFVRRERGFLNEAETHSSLPDRLVSELNKQTPTHSETEWLKILRAWIDLVSNPSTNRVLFTEDLVLLRYITSNGLATSDTAKLKPNTLCDIATHCRICMASSSTKMLFLFKPRNGEEVSLLHKLNYCSCFTTRAKRDDNLPKYICMSCSILVENAYQLKVLCAKSEEKFKQLLNGRNENHINTVEKKSRQKRRKTSAQLEEEIMNMNIEFVDIEEAKNEDVPSNTQNVERKASDKLVPEKEETLKMEKIPSKKEKRPLKSKPVREFRCDICTAVFASKSRVRFHMTEKHVGEAVRKKPFPCEECGKRFRVKNALTVHLRCHTNERPYNCKVCGKAFKTISALSNHNAVHSETKNFMCSSCAFTTNTKNNLRIHERTHTGVQPYTCQFCPMKFRTASNVVKHMRNIHEKQKTNTCDECGRSFFSRESLRKHSISHTGLKPFICPQNECSGSYVWYNGLKKHIRQQHPDGSVKLPKETFYFHKLKDILPA